MLCPVHMILKHCVLRFASLSVDFVDDQFVHFQPGHHPQLKMCQYIAFIKDRQDMNRGGGIPHYSR